MTPQQQERVLEMYGLNDSLPMQYVKYIKNMLKGDLGTSFTYVNQDVSKVITGRLGPSALIGIQAVLIGLAIGLILGILAAWKHNSGIDYFTMILAVLGVSVPNFVAAALLQYYIGLKWGVLPVGSGPAGTVPYCRPLRFHLVQQPWLPALCVQKCWMYWIRIIS